MSNSIDSNLSYDSNYIYDKYSALLYGIILKISPNEKEADSILIKSFNAFFLQKLYDVHEKVIFLDLLKITIKITSEHINISKQDIGKIILKDFHQ